MNKKEERLIDLDDAVINALDFLSDKRLPKFNFSKKKRYLVLGSGNALSTGKILFSDYDAVFANESNYKEKVKNFLKIDCIVLISASGGKHSIEIAKFLKNKRTENYFFTCNSGAPAKKYFNKKNVFVFPKLSEPYTYNVSTYFGMIFSKTRENPKKILKIIKNSKNKISKLNLSKHNSYYFIIPEKFQEIGEMFLTKFDELFGSKITVRAFTKKQTLHAKTIVQSEKELFVSFNEKIKLGKNNFNLNISERLNYGLLMSLGYYFIGKIQKSNPDWFKRSINDYCDRISKKFNQKIQIRA